METATADNGRSICVLITTLALPPAGAPLATVVTLGVPEPFQPRVCNTSALESSLVAHCPGLPTVSVVSGRPPYTVSAGDGGGASGPAQLQLVLPSSVGGIATLVASVAPGASADEAVPGRRSTVLAPISHDDVVAIVAAARATLVASFAKYGTKNETFAGMQTAVSWNVVYTPYEGIFTPVFRGSPWAVSRPHNYVLFEWDTFLSSLLAAVTDSWSERC